MAFSISVLVVGALLSGPVAVADSTDAPVLVAALQSDDQACSTGNTGTAGVSATGKAGDSFTIALKCGSVVVAQCTATVNSGGVGQCEAHGQMPNNDAKTCPVTPAKGNSKSASVMATDCF